jgi:hypothetical protein
MLREMPGDVVPAHIRQIEIHEQDRGPEFDSQSKGSRAGVRDACITVALRLDQRGERIRGIRVIIDYQYARQASRCTALAPLPGLGRAHDGPLKGEL